MAPNPTRLAQKHFTIQSKNGHQNQYMKQAYTRRSNVISKAQANMHTSRNNQCNPDMQCSNTWTMETSHDCKLNTNSIINNNKKLGSIERFGRTSGFSSLT